MGFSNWQFPLLFLNVCISFTNISSFWIMCCDILACLVLSLGIYHCRTPCFSSLKMPHSNYPSSSSMKILLACWIFFHYIPCLPLAFVWSSEGLFLFPPFCVGCLPIVIIVALLSCKIFSCTYGHIWGTYLLMCNACRRTCRYTQVTQPNLVVIL